jgi:hypothetical protein
LRYSLAQNSRPTTHSSSGISFCRNIRSAQSTFEPLPACLGLCGICANPPPRGPARCSSAPRPVKSMSIWSRTPGTSAPPQDSEAAWGSIITLTMAALIGLTMAGDDATKAILCAKRGRSSVT